MTRNFGCTKEGNQASLYVIRNENGMEAAVTDLGATLVSLKVKNKEGSMADVVLGYENAAGYEAGTCFFGTIVGRNANRIGGAQFELNGKTYHLTGNDNGNNLHSGMDFYNIRIWETEEVTETSVRFKLHSPDGDQGYPGALDMKVTYTLDEENGLTIHYEAVPDQDTVINMTNHSYFNLNGHKSGSVLHHRMQLLSDAFTPADAQSIPTGEVCSVDGTPMDFRSTKELGAEIDAAYEPLILGNGYDHNWVLKNEGRFDKVAVFNKIASTRMVPVFYHKDVEIVKKVVKSCYDGGVRVFEFTNRGDFAHEVFCEVVKYAAKECPDMAVGVGSVVDSATAALYIQLGASFVVGPLFNPEIAKICNRRLVTYMPGCGTVSEIGFAQESGCDLCKVFPGDVYGPNFVKGILAPMPWSKLMVTGGVEPTEENLKSWIKSGVYCVGMGSKLFPKDVLEKGDWGYITNKCREVLNYISEF